MITKKNHKRHCKMLLIICIIICIILGILHIKNENEVELTQIFSGMQIKLKPTNSVQIYGNENLTMQWSKEFSEHNVQIYSATVLQDNGYVVGGYFDSDTLKLGEDLVLTSDGSFEGLIIKYNEDGNVQWAKAIGGTKINSVVATSDGGFMAGGYFSDGILQLKDGTKLTSNGSMDGMIIKYDKDGNVQWAKGIGGEENDEIKSIAETSDGGIIAGGYFSGGILQLKDDTKLTSNGSKDGMIVKYDRDGNLLWGKSIGGIGNDEINSIAITTNGEIVIGGYIGAKSEITIRDEQKITSKGYNDAMVVKCNETGELQWGATIGGEIDDDEAKAVVATSDGGFIIGGYFKSDTEIDLENGKSLTSQGREDGMIVKYNSKGIAEWGKSIGGAGSDYITSLAITLDGRCLVGGYFDSNTIQLENNQTLKSEQYQNGMVIIYNSEGNVELGQTIAGNYDDTIYSVVSTTKKEILAVGSTLQIKEEGGSGTNNSVGMTQEYLYYGLIVKLKEPDLINLKVSKIWDDDNNINKLRPSQIKVKLTGKGMKKEETDGQIRTCRKNTF